MNMTFLSVLWDFVGDGGTIYVMCSCICLRSHPIMIIKLKRVCVHLDLWGAFCWIYVHHIITDQTQVQVQIQVKVQVKVQAQAQVHKYIYIYINKKKYIYYKHKHEYKYTDKYRYKNKYKYRYKYKHKYLLITYHDMVRRRYKNKNK